MASRAEPLKALALTVALSTFLLAALSVPAASMIRPTSEGPFESEPSSSGGDWMLDQRGNVTPGEFRRALDRSAAVQDRTAVEAPELAGAQWEAMGPTNIGGRVADVAIDPTQADTVYAATASGGVWKSTDAGATWSYAWAPELTQSTGAIAIAPDGTIYVGTGESSPGGGSITYGGTGLFRSTDDGATWQPLGLQSSGAIGRIVLDPSNPSRVIVAASGHLYKPGGHRGLIYSTQGGNKWRMMLPGQNATTGAVDVAIDPSNPNNMLAAMWDHHRVAGFRLYAGEGSGVWRSSDAGRTWTEIDIPHGIDPAHVGRIGVAFAPSNPQRAYVIVANQLNGRGVGFFRSDDGGLTFSKTAVGGGSLSQSEFGWWFGRVWVDPTNPDTVWVPGTSLLRSVNGGDSFTSVGGVHADQHAMAWDPQVPNRVYLGNDGGMYTSDDNGLTWESGAEQGWTQHYTVDVGELTPDHVVTGLQDNGCLKNWNGSESGPDVWTSFGSCGDGLETLINPTHEQTLYACAQYGSCGIAVAGAPLGIPMTTTSDRRGWWTPLVFDPSNSMTMYFAGNRVNRSLNGGISWSAISGDLTKNEPQMDPHAGYRIRGVVTTVAAAKSAPTTVWAGTDDGLLWKTTDAHLPSPTWTQIEDPALPDAWITRVAVDPTDEDVVYVTSSNYRDGNDAAHVLKTEDGGETWTNISGDLPPAPVSDVVPIGDRVVVASDVGVFVTEDGSTWYRLGENLPAVPVIELRYHEGTNTLTAATFGHGIQRIALPF